MPIYCYKCFDCEHYEEIKQGFEDEPLDTCPECGAQKFKRVIRNVGVIFKGSGWHITDYSKKKTLPATGESSSVHKTETETPASDTTTTSETTPVTKTELKTESRSESAGTSSPAENK